MTAPFASPLGAANEPLDADGVERITLLFKAFADPTRVRILHELLDSELRVGDIAKRVKMSPSAVSHQLAFLRTMRLVKNRRDGRTVVYALDDEHVRQLFRQGIEHVVHS